MKVHEFLLKTAETIRVLQAKVDEAEKVAKITEFVDELYRQGVYSEIQKEAKKRELVEKSSDEVDSIIKTAETLDVSFTLRLAKEAGDLDELSGEDAFDDWLLNG
jgi:hypothetical protein